MKFWSTEYIKIVLGLSATNAMIGYGIVTVTAPIFGVIIGGRIADKLVSIKLFFF